MPVEGVIPHLPGIDMYGNTIPDEIVGGDVFEYMNFQQRYNIEARIHQAEWLAKRCLVPLAPGAKARNSVDEHIQWLSTRPGYADRDGVEFRKAKSSEQFEIKSRTCGNLYLSAGVLIVDAQGHGIIAAKIASTIRDTLQAFMPRSWAGSGTDHAQAL